MESIRNRARDQLPSVLLTLLSIIQAIALETLWGHILGRPDLLAATPQAALGWVQVLATLQCIILVWLVYVGSVMRFRWTPTIGDLSLPFLLGLGELVLIESMSQGNPGPWILLVAALFGFLHLFTHSLFGRARRDPENTEFFLQIGPATAMDQLRRALGVAGIAGLAVIAWGDDSALWLQALVMLSVLGGVCFQVGVVARYWQKSMGTLAL